MIESNIPCQYHSNRNAVTKCEMCQKATCVECKMVYKQFHMGSTDFIGSRENDYYTHYELCRPCYYDRHIKELNSPGMYCIFVSGCISTIISFIIFLFTMNFVSTWDGPSSIPAPTILPFFAFIFILIGIGTVIIGMIKIENLPKKISEFEAKRQVFFAELSSTTETSEQIIKYNFCPVCGEKFYPDEKICKKCGIEIETFI
ncbi:MAG: hypothetical protein ACFFAS_04305 [Promethearchaeota archaeon]